MASYLLDKDQQGRLISGLNGVLEHAVTNNAYLRGKYAGVNGPIRTMSQLAEIPPLLRSEVQQHYPYGLLCVDRTAIPAYYETSGSTGGSIPVYPDNDPARDVQLATYLDFWMGLRTGKVHMAMVALPYEMNPMGLKFHRALQQLEITVIPVSVRSCLSPPAKVVDLISRLSPALLVGRPLEIMRYAEALEMRGHSAEDSSVRKIFFTGETMSDSKFARISAMFGGADVYSTYGLTELDVGLTTCSHNHYHLPESDNLIIEVLDQNGEATGNGEDGEVVITSLRKAIVPYIRYKTGDVAQWRANCLCESKNPYLILRGRSVDEMTFNGKKVFPVDIENILLRERDIGCEYQFVVEDGNLIISAEMAIGKLPDIALQNRLKKSIADGLGFKASIQLLPHNQLADKFGIAKGKGCRFVDITGITGAQREKSLRINICSGEDLQ